MRIQKNFLIVKMDIMCYWFVLAITVFVQWRYGQSGSKICCCIPGCKFI